MLSFIRRLFQRQPDAARVASLVLGRLQQQLPGETLVFDPAQYLIRRTGNGVIYLNNIYRDYCQAAPSRRSEEIARFVLGVVGSGEQPDDLEAARPRLLPVLRYLAGLDLLWIPNEDLAKPHTPKMIWRPFSPALGVAVAIDSEHSIAQVGRPDLERWGITFDEAFAIAVDNLRHKAAPAFTQVSPGLYMSHYGDYYDAARVLLQELAWQLPLAGEPVAMMPNRVCLLLCGADDPAALADMVGRARQILREQSRPLSSEMFRLRGNAWAPWSPQGEAGGALAQLQREDRMADYAEQKAALEKAHEAAGIDVFVAAHTLIQRNSDGAFLSYAVLPKGVDTWLPEADLIVLSESAEGEPTMVSWAHFVEHASHLLERLSFAAPRWKVLGFPEGECLRKLRQVATNWDDAKV
ncbi:hypothetical protein [Variovorax sp. E3]|uniref:hypothetical protein n=1 Tax=Variovorax sp. E3 TaxID=1914993 RepID=UPI0018DC493A|nr:hypothetical protein [Variovorax sp. E3]